MTDLAALGRAFEERYGAPPHTAVRAPGRVNLIGEHVDYNGLPVMPLALQRELCVAFRARDDAVVRIASLNPGFGPREFTLAPDLPPYPLGDWGNYVKAAGRALVRLHGPLRGLEAMVTSDIPVAAGLSSSSALVVAMGLALLRANDRIMMPLTLAQELSRAERFTGTQGGGMDQAICLCAKAGTAARVDFHPLRVTPHPFPDDWRVVVASSLERAEKAGAAQRTYNRRAEECAAALAAVSARLGLSGAGYRELLRSASQRDLLAAAEAALADPIRRRFRHVVTEADRVTLAEDAMVSQRLEAFGAQLDASHTSLRNDYEVSTTALDELVAVARAAGAAGARLTGAGMGGCIVAVCHRDHAAGLLAALDHEFYDPRGVEGDRTLHRFLATPAGGARIAPF